MSDGMDASREDYNHIGRTSRSVGRFCFFIGPSLDTVTGKRGGYPLDDKLLILSSLTISLKFTQLTASVSKVQPFACCTSKIPATVILYPVLVPPSLVSPDQTSRSRPSIRYQYPYNDRSVSGHSRRHQGLTAIRAVSEKSTGNQVHSRGSNSGSTSS